ncbi:MAG: hypothetical protein A3B99_04935 [Candidatus Yanofskybacteria bacterium RIFCSPHIGHO2_02_FULL_44_12b]|uniref:AB hydrolase-1 domain-containing protein n=2 Tax=Candidatus Yanofskyibacteriota TaxID=1752733 RepID=A0A1F8GM60_9BACT|nr:MAG: hypothetical protein UW79_C0024G0005 [Candidatus Yanofskybacteria bacterium GW2011_GWA2_44_9]OGN04399.1 MAG: hypothetical protein A2659_03665 [Candidatus Yanofskybacteria bacterium RIFCSPHIGHO2_01_FULL_44_24]OGN16195.1 MAG: hypothetical protein A3B99_04935 [Candidatus Yanofskybacteria bacterium RIFCSPHIGHO2_02_FULL_44_12b]OGN25788.1 MAG: hypothetical protein A2925_01200 [Candidatus Yanofskybacteria bacterium RIFCSPLOWO2_01_FULL_44_22]
MKNQVIVIHGGDSFDNYRDYLKFLRSWKINFDDYIQNRAGWKKNLAKKLGKDFQVILPNMPNSFNAKYSEWKIWFDKFVPYFKSGVIMVGHSMGGIFLAKYLSENKLSKKVKAVFLIAAPYDDKDSEYSLVDFILPKSLKKLEQQAGKIFIYQSKEDPVVPFADFGKYQKSLKNSIGRVFLGRGHFNQEDFPELIRDIKGLYK